MEIPLPKHLKYYRICQNQWRMIYVHVLQSERQVSSEPSVQVCIHNATVCNKIRGYIFMSHVFNAYMEIPEHAHSGKGQSPDIKCIKIR